MRNQVPFSVVLLLALGFSVRPTNQAAKPDDSNRLDLKKTPQSGEPQKSSPEEAVRQDMKETVDRFIGPLETNSEWRFLIATVPNPEIAYCALPFDSTVESIQRAADAEGYQLRQFWLPWERSGDGKDSGDKKDDNLRRKKALDEQYGMLLFRGNDPDDKLAVLLVGETPTLGLNYAAFAGALDFIRTHGSVSTVSIVGPTYSGTAIQLKEAIQAARRSEELKNAQFILSSGSASSVKKDQIEERPFLTYHAFSENVDVMQQSFLKYLHDDLGIDEDRVALLSETGTAFGNSLRPASKERLADLEAKALRKPAEVLHLPFPMAIGRLRNARESDPALSGPTAAEGAQARKGLELKLNDTESRKTDRVPTFSPELSAVSQEMVMQNITASIRREHIKAVGVSATDILDALFLAQMVRDLCPNTLVFIFNSDNLFQHVSPKVSYYGLLLVSPYPLFTGNQMWQRADDAPRQLQHFSNRPAQGVFNAVRWSLAGDRGGLIEYGDPSVNSMPHPPVWVTVVGRGSLWPVKILDAPEKTSPEKVPSAMADVNQATRKAADTSWLPRPSALWYAGLSVLTILGGWRLLHSAGRWLPIRIAPVYEVPETLGAEALSYQLAVELGLLAAIVPSAWVLHKYVGLAALDAGSRMAHQWMFYLMAGIAVGLALLTIIWAFYLRRSIRWPVAVFFVAAAVTVAAVVLYVTQWLPTGHVFNRRLFVLRCLFPEAGVSPLVPPALMCLGIASWAGMQLQRLRLCEIRWPGYPDMSGADFRLTGLNGCAAAVTQSVESIRKNWWPAILGVGVFSVLMSFFKVHGLEWQSYDHWVSVASSILAALIVFTLARFLTLWFVLRTVLTRLDRHSIRDGFQRLGKKIPDFSAFAIWRVWHVWQRDSRRHALVTLVPSLHRLVAIQDWVDKEDLGKASRAVGEVLTVDASNGSEKISSVSEAAGALNRIAASLVEKRLPALWKGFAETQVKAAVSGGADTITVASSPPDSDRLEAAEDFVALRWAAFIRSVHAQLRNKLEFMTTGCILLLLSTVAYPVRPHHTLVLLISLLFMSSGLGAVLVFYQMERNPILSRMSHKTPGAVGKQFYTSAIAYGAVPVITLLAYQFPELSRFLFSIVGPTVQSLR